MASVPNVNNMKRLIALLALFITAAALTVAVAAFFMKAPQAAPVNVVNTEPESIPTVVVSMFHLAEWTKAVAGNSVEVILAVPAGTEPHDFVPSAREIAAYTDADIVIGNGGGVDGWVEKLRSSRAAAQKSTLVLSDRIDFVNNDPHIWLDLELAQESIDAIANALSAQNPSLAETYRANAEKEKQRLAELDAAYRNTLTGCEKKDVIVAHDAFGYLGRRYGLTMHGILGLSPDDEPSAQELVRLARQAKAWNVTTIFFEELASPDVAQTLADELQLETAVLNPLEGLTVEQEKNGVTYHSLMQSNLTALTNELCQK